MMDYRVYINGVVGTYHPYMLKQYVVVFFCFDCGLTSR